LRVGAPADAIFDVPDMHVLDVEVDQQQQLVLTIEFGSARGGLPDVRGARGRRRPPGRMLHDTPCFGGVTLLRWLVRI
jgi:hypothetical protein